MLAIQLPVTVLLAGLVAWLASQTVFDQPPGATPTVSAFVYFPDLALKSDGTGPPEVTDTMHVDVAQETGPGQELSLAFKTSLQRKSNAAQLTARPVELVFLSPRPLEGTCRIGVEGRIRDVALVEMDSARTNLPEAVRWTADVLLGNAPLDSDDPLAISSDIWTSAHVYKVAFDISPDVFDSDSNMSSRSTLDGRTP